MENMVLNELLSQFQGNCNLYGNISYKSLSH